MTALQRQQQAARLATLAKVRAYVDSEGTITVKAPLYCDPKLRGHRLIPRTVLS